MPAIASDRCKIEIRGLSTNFQHRHSFTNI